MSSGVSDGNCRVPVASWSPLRTGQPIKAAGLGCIIAKRAPTARARRGSMGRSMRGRVASSGWASSVVGEGASMTEKKTHCVCICICYLNFG